MKIQLLVAATLTFQLFAQDPGADDRLFTSLPDESKISLRQDLTAMPNMYFTEVGSVEISKSTGTITQKIYPKGRSASYNEILPEETIPYTKYVRPSCAILHAPSPKERVLKATNKFEVRTVRSRAGITPPAWKTPWKIDRTVADEPYVDAYSYTWAKTPAVFECTKITHTYYTPYQTSERESWATDVIETDASKITVGEVRKLLRVEPSEPTEFK